MYIFEEKARVPPARQDRGRVGWPKRVTSDFCAASPSLDDDGRCLLAALVHRHRRDWTVNEPARRTNHGGDSPRASLLASRASSFYRIGRPKDEESEGEKRESLRQLERGLEWIRISRSSDGIVPRFLLLRLLLCSFLHSYTATSERRLVSRSMPRKCPSQHISRERSQSERIALRGSIQATSDYTGIFRWCLAD